LLFTLPLVLSESSSRPLGHILGAVAGGGARGGTVRGGLPWDINRRFSSARHRQLLLSVRLGVNMQSRHSERGRGRSGRLGWGEGGGRRWDGGDLGGRYGSKRPRCLIVSHTRRGSDFGCNSRGNGHRLNYLCRFSLCEMKNKKETHKTTPNTCMFLSRDFCCSRGGGEPA